MSKRLRQKFDIHQHNSETIKFQNNFAVVIDTLLCTKNEKIIYHDKIIFDLYRLEAKICNVCTLVQQFFCARNYKDGLERKRKHSRRFKIVMTIATMTSSEENDIIIAVPIKTQVLKAEGQCVHLILYYTYRIKH